RSRLLIGLGPRRRGSVAVRCNWSLEHPIGVAVILTRLQQCFFSHVSGLVVWVCARNCRTAIHVSARHTECIAKCLSRPTVRMTLTGGCQCSFSLVFYQHCVFFRRTCRHAACKRLSEGFMTRVFKSRHRIPP